MAEIAGLKLIVPSSVSATGAGSSVTVSATGKITFTSAETLSINGCFSSTYDNYLIVASHKSSSGGQEFQIRLRASGSDDTGSNYTYQFLAASGTTISGGRTTNTFGRVGYMFTNPDGDHVYLYGPYLAQQTAMRNVNVYSNNGVTIFDFATTHSLSTSYDGCTLYPAGGGGVSMTGALTIYGLSQ